MDQGNLTLHKREAGQSAGAAHSYSTHQVVVAPPGSSSWLSGGRRHQYMERRLKLRYGENPHQQAAFYVDPSWKYLAGRSLPDAMSAAILFSHFFTAMPRQVAEQPSACWSTHPVT